jgi:multicomponent Na+:H+ antiporter subunit E
VRRLAVFLLLLGFWVLCSGYLDPLHLGFGLVCTALVTAWSADLLLPPGRSAGAWTKLWRGLAYLPWLLYQIVLANLHVVYLVIFPHELRPQIVRFRSRLRSELALVTLANSITLTPGTVTMDIEDGEFWVHAVSDKVARDLREGDMERRVAHVFLEG